MFMRIIWGKILPGQWDAFETAFKKALETRGKPKGLQGQWLIRDENDPDAGYSISQWDSDPGHARLLGYQAAQGCDVPYRAVFRKPVHHH